jgi:hypothetical protein
MDGGTLRLVDTDIMGGGTLQPLRVDPAIQSDNGAVFIDPNCVLAPVGRPTAGTSTFTWESVATPALELPVTVQTGGWAVSVFSGIPHAASAVGIGLPGPPVPTPFGTLWVDPALFLPVGSGTADMFGRYTAVSFVHSLLEPGVPLAFQAIVLDNGVLRLSTPLTAVVGFF